MSKVTGARSSGGTRQDKNGTTIKLVQFHMPADLFEELVRRAAADDRTVSKQVLHYVRAAVSASEQTR